jgi:hypothetical protein
MSIGPLTGYPSLHHCLAPGMIARGLVHARRDTAAGKKLLQSHAGLLWPDSKGFGVRCLRIGQVWSAWRRRRRQQGGQLRGRTLIQGRHSLRNRDQECQTPGLGAWTPCSMRLGSPFLPDSLMFHPLLEATTGAQSEGPEQ